MILYGAGNQGEVVFESLLLQGEIVRAVFDDDEEMVNFRGLSVQHTYRQDYLPHEKMLISIGSNTARQRIAARVKHAFGMSVDGNAVVMPAAVHGVGIMVMPGAVIQSHASIGDHVIINSGAVVEHHVNVGNFAHIGPGAVICGNAVIKEGVMIGANATVLPGVTIGEWAVVGAGSVVTKDVEIGEKMAGNPARKM